MLLLQRVRDESHRFAIEFQRELRSKVNMTSILEELPGIGPGKRRALLKTLEHPRDGVFALLNSECVRRDGKDENLLKQLLKKHERAPFVGERRGPLPGVFVPRVSVKSTSAERADALSVFGCRTSPRT